MIIFVFLSLFSALGFSTTLTCAQILGQSFSSDGFLRSALSPKEIAIEYLNLYQKVAPELLNSQLYKGIEATQNPFILPANVIVQSSSIPNLLAEFESLLGDAHPRPVLTASILKHLSTYISAANRVDKKIQRTQTKDNLQLKVVKRFVDGDLESAGVFDHFRPQFFQMGAQSYLAYRPRMDDRRRNLLISIRLDDGSVFKYRRKRNENHYGVLNAVTEIDGKPYLMVTSTAGIRVFDESLSEDSASLGNSLAMLPEPPEKIDDRHFRYWTSIISIPGSPHLLATTSVINVGKKGKRPNGRSKAGAPATSVFKLLNFKTGQPEFQTPLSGSQELVDTLVTANAKYFLLQHLNKISILKIPRSGSPLYISSDIEYSNGSISNGKLFLSQSGELGFAFFNENGIAIVKTDGLKFKSPNLIPIPNLDDIEVRILQSENQVLALAQTFDQNKLRSNSTKSSSRGIAIIELISEKLIDERPLENLDGGFRGFTIENEPHLIWGRSDGKVSLSPLDGSYQKTSEQLNPTEVNSVTPYPWKNGWRAFVTFTSKSEPQHTGPVILHLNGPQ